MRAIRMSPLCASHFISPLLSTCPLDFASPVPRPQMEESRVHFFFFFLLSPSSDIIVLDRADDAREHEHAHALTAPSRSPIAVTWASEHSHERGSESRGRGRGRCRTLRTRATHASNSFVLEGHKGCCWEHTIRFWRTKGRGASKRRVSRVLCFSRDHTRTSSTE